MREGRTEHYAEILDEVARSPVYANGVQMRQKENLTS